MTSTLYVIDGHAQIYRAFYAPFRELTSPSGEPTRATHVFCQMLFNLIRNRKPDYLVMTLDVDDRTVFRATIDPDYKAHRDPAPEGLGLQADRIESIVRALGVPVFQVPGFEADDLMATITERLRDVEVDIHLVSRDKDLEQLMGNRVHLYDVGHDVTIDVEALRSSKGYGPEQAVEVQTLAGDSTDNVPGIPGVGVKTAAKLIAQYGTAQAVLDHADELPAKLAERVRAFATQLPITRQLVTLRRDVPLEFDLESCRVDRLTPAAVRPIFKELGFTRLVENLEALTATMTTPSEDRIRRTGETADAKGMTTGHTGQLFGEMESETAPDSDETTAGRRRKKAAIPEEQAPPGLYAPTGEATTTRESATDDATHGSILSSPGRYELVNTSEKLARLARQLEKLPAFAFDTETTGLSPVDAEVVGLSFSWNSGEGHYVAIQGTGGPTLSESEVVDRLGPVMADRRIGKIGHHLKFDLQVARRSGMEVRGLQFDTLIAAALLEPQRSSHSLDGLVRSMLGHAMIPISDLIGKGRNQIRMNEVDIGWACIYAAEDADFTWRLKERLEPRMGGGHAESLFRETEMPLLEVLADMEWNGITLDVKHLGVLGRQLGERLDELTTEVHRTAGRPFNLDSPKQLGEVLFDDLGLPVVRKTKTGRSTDAETLEVLASQTEHPLPRLVLEYRELSKLKGTYVDTLPTMVSPRTGRVHASFHQTGAVTGRLSSSDPNLQNIPIRTETGRRIREAFVAGSPETVLLVADYSQIELRLLAHFCGDEALLAAFRAGHDIHRAVAAQVNGVPESEVTAEQRSAAKAVNFGIIYGQSAFGLARSLGISRTAAQEFIERYFQKYPGIRGFIDQCVADARSRGYAETILGRRRPIDELNSRNRAQMSFGERIAVNTVVQGSAADLIKRAMVDIHRAIRSGEIPGQMLIQVHDELVFEVPRDQSEAAAQSVKSRMERALPLKVPIVVDLGIGRHWSQAKE